MKGGTLYPNCDTWKQKEFGSPNKKAQGQFANKQLKPLECLLTTTKPLIAVCAKVLYITMAWKKLIPHAYHTFYMISLRDLHQANHTPGLLLRTPT